MKHITYIQQLQLNFLVKTQTYNAYKQEREREKESSKDGHIKRKQIKINALTHF
jgi:hypothetical protein